MSDKVKIALVIASAAIICVAMALYFSPYHSCVRSGQSEYLCARGD